MAATRSLLESLDALADALIGRLLGERVLQTIPNEDGRFVVVTTSEIDRNAVVGVGPVAGDVSEEETGKYLVDLDERNRRILAAGLLAGLPVQDWQVIDEERTSGEHTRMVTAIRTASGNHEIALISDFGDQAEDPERPWVWLLAAPAKVNGASPTRDQALMAVALAINVGPAGN